MPWFSSCCEGADEYLCQACGHSFCSNCKPSTWVDDPKFTVKGNVCPTCMRRYFPTLLVTNKVTKKG